MDFNNLVKNNIKNSVVKDYFENFNTLITEKKYKDAGACYVNIVKIFGDQDDISDHLNYLILIYLENGLLESDNFNVFMDGIISGESVGSFKDIISKKPSKKLSEYIKTNIISYFVNRLNDLSYFDLKENQLSNFNKLIKDLSGLGKDAQEFNIIKVIRKNMINYKKIKRGPNGNYPASCVSLEILALDENKKRFYINKKIEPVYSREEKEEFQFVEAGDILIVLKGEDGTGECIKNLTLEKLIKNESINKNSFLNQLVDNDQCEQCIDDVNKRKFNFLGEKI